MNNYFDLAFKLSATGNLPADHGYALYGALSNVFAEIHEMTDIGIHPIRGVQIGQRELSLNDSSRLSIRLASDRIPLVLPLSGKAIQVADTQLRIGVPEVRTLQPTTALRSRLVTIKLTNGDLSEESFLTAIKEKLQSLEVSDQAITTLAKRRTLRVKDKEIVGYETIVEGLSADESTKLLQCGLGGRRKMGCGLFVALR